MIRDVLERSTDFVTERSRITLLVMVLLTAAVLAGIPQLDTGSEAGVDEDAFDDLERVQKAEYIEENYSRDEDRQNRTVQTVYVWTESGNALSNESLMAGLYYQQEVSENESVQAALHDDGIVGFENLVAARAADEPDPDLETQIDVLESASESEVEQLVAATLAEDPRSQRFLPADHDPESTSSTDRRILVTIDTSTSPETRAAAEAALYEHAQERSDSGFFTFAGPAFTEANEHFFAQMVQLVVPVALGLILFVLVFSYRDLVDIVVGMTGVGLSVAWMFGIMGWLGVAAGIVSIVPVVLITGLSIDFGFHVFNRYREQRGPDEGIREPMSRGTLLVATALLLVTVTAAIGFLSNLANPLGQIRNLGVSITLGVVSAFVIFLTVVPALKISIDSALERFGFDRRKQALGRGKYLAPVLRGSVTLARRAAPLALVVAIVAGAVGGFAWTELDREEFDYDNDVAEWKQQLPGPLGWERHELGERFSHVDDVYRPASEDDATASRILIEGDVTDDDTLEDIEAGVEEIRTEDGDLLLEQAGTRSVRSPVTAMRAVAERNESFAAVYEASDTDGDGVPDRDLESLYDAFYGADEGAVSAVIERTDGEYRSVLVTLVIESDFTDRSENVATLESGAAVMEGGDRTATVVGQNAIIEDMLAELVEGVVLTMFVALSTIVVVLTLAFRVMHGSATLGTVTAVPIALVVGLVIAGMYLLDIPLNLLTALLMSLVIGLGIDYNIHVGDRFADELREGRSVYEALEAAVTGTGGALLGSTLTSAGAFTTLLLVPSADIQGFGTIVVAALLTAFLVSVLVLPSVLALWSRYAPRTVTAPASVEEAASRD